MTYPVTDVHWMIRKFLSHAIHLVEARTGVDFSDATTSGFAGVRSTPATTRSTAQENGRGGQAALIYDSPVTGRRGPSAMTSCATRSRPSPALLWQGVGDDRVIIYMPMIRLSRCYLCPHRRSTGAPSASLPANWRRRRRLIR
jgi:hypothetical protein